MAKSPVKAIREFCLECCGGSRAEVKSCLATRCPLYAFRFGKNPYIKRDVTDEQKSAMRDRLADARAKKYGATEL